jgi:hypothetical protein
MWACRPSKRGHCLSLGNCFTLVIVRRLMAILLLAILGFTLGTPLLAFAAEGEGKMPVCCRKDGQHRCVAMKATSGNQSILIGGKCPYFPKATTLASSTIKFVPVASIFYVEALRHPGYSPQTEAHLRISFDRSRQKRGPPLRFL